MKKPRLTAFWPTGLALAIMSLSFSAVPAVSRLTQAADLITEQNLKAEIAFLASDDLAGRNAGSPEDHIATDYIATEFMRLGLKPMGDNGTYFQKMEILTGELDRQQVALTAKVAGAEHTYTLNKDFQWLGQSLRPTSVCAPAVFAGYGIDAPEFGYNDFANIDVKGKVVLVLSREPQADNPQSKFMGTWDTYHAFIRYKLEAIRKMGAAGVLLIQDRGPSTSKPTPASSPRARGGTLWALAGEMWDLPAFSIRREVADELLAASGKKVDDLQTGIDSSLHPESFEVPDSSVCLRKAFTNVQSHEGRNVVALMEGSDPKLKGEAVILTAHHDHMGISEGHIYHGADDNASGVAGLIGTARAFVRGNVHPRRSVLFVAYDGEERIFLGSYYYVTHPAIPLSNTAATINLDMIGRDENDANWPVPPDGNVNMVNVLGTRYNEGLRRVIDRQNRPIGLTLDYKMDVIDPDSLWARSDHFWFATLHIPQVEFQTGLHPDYHTENDTWTRINYPKLTKIVRLVFLSIVDIANAPRRVEFTAAGMPPKTTTEILRNQHKATRGTGLRAIQHVSAP